MLDASSHKKLGMKKQFGKRSNGRFVSTKITYPSFITVSEIEVFGSLLDRNFSPANDNGTV